MCAAKLECMLFHRADLAYPVKHPGKPGLPFRWMKKQLGAVLFGYAGQNWLGIVGLSFNGAVSVRTAEALTISHTAVPEVRLRCPEHTSVYHDSVRDLDRALCAMCCCALEVAMWQACSCKSPASTRQPLCWASNVKSAFKERLSCV